MRQTWVLSVFVAVCGLASSAGAQTPAGPPSRPPAAAAATKDTGFFAGATAGAASVQNVGGLFGGEAGFGLSDNLDVFGEGLWMEDVVTRRRLGLANTIGTYLQTSQGKAATGTVVAPAAYGGAGVRFAFMTSGAVRPYVAFSVGAAHIALRPAFTLSGSDVTAALSQYGVTIGSDLTGEVTKPAFSGGGGVRFAPNRWYVDGGVRVISIRTTDQTTNVLRASVSLGVKF
jgi:hypothetical protein